MFLLQQLELIIIKVIIRGSLWGEVFGQALRTIWERLQKFLFCSSVLIADFPVEKRWWRSLRCCSILPWKQLFHFLELPLISNGNFTLFLDKIQADPSSVCTSQLICIDFPHSVLLLHTITSQHQKDTKLWANLAR